jgi:hypothetical protein
VLDGGRRGKDDRKQNILVSLVERVDQLKRDGPKILLPLNVPVSLKEKMHTKKNIVPLHEQK